MHGFQFADLGCVTCLGIHAASRPVCGHVDHWRDAVGHGKSYCTITKIRNLKPTVEGHGDVSSHDILPNPFL
jgi:hypothetical protein